MFDGSPLGIDAGVDRVVAVWAHEGRAAELICDLKYGRATRVVTELAESMAAAAPAADLITWIPASPSRRRSRGFDQSELLARAIGRRAGLRVKRLLRRVDDIAQTSRDRSGRQQGPEFAAVGATLRFKPTVLLVDDVYTSGATLRSAAMILRARGAAELIGLVATRASRRDGHAQHPSPIYDQSTRLPTGGKEWTSPSAHGM